MPPPPQPPLPALFLSHGSPMIAIEPGEAGQFMRDLGPAIDRLWGRPRAIVAMSPHTSASSTFVLAGARHEAIHDFGGFPEALYQLRYDAPGDPVLALDVVSRLVKVDPSARGAAQGGLDHGIWTTLMYLYPQADVPVVPISLKPQASPAEVMALGRALHGLRHEGVLVIGSGSLTHNLSRLFGPGSPPSVNAPEDPDCAAFRLWVHSRAEAADWPALLDYRSQAPAARAMHPTDEHWLPFYFAAGAGVEDGNEAPRTAARLHAGVTYGHLAMDAYGFGESARQLVSGGAVR